MALKQGSKMKTNLLQPATLILLLCGSSASAEIMSKTIPGEQDIKTFSIAQIANHEVLVEREKAITVCDNGDCIQRSSNLRVSYLLVDYGPSTDVSPRGGLYLSMHNSIEEHAVAASLHFIAPVEDFIAGTRKEAGIYVFDIVSSLNGDAAGDCYYKRVTVTVDAREASAAVRKGEKTRFFEDAVYTDPVFVDYKTEGCSE